MSSFRFTFVALARKTKASEVSVGAFYYLYDDLISYEFYPPLLARPFNFSKAQVAGVEVEGQMTFSPWLWAQGSYTYLFSQNLTEDARFYQNALPHRPRHKAHAKLLGGPKWLQGRAEVFYQSSLYFNRTETLELPGRALVNAGVTAKLRKSQDMSLSLEVKNLLDTYTQDLDGYPLPSRGVYVTWAWEAALSKKQ